MQFSFQRIQNFSQCAPQFSLAAGREKLGGAPWPLSAAHRKYISKPESTCWDPRTLGPGKAKTPLQSSERKTATETVAGSVVDLGLKNRLGPPRPELHVRLERGE